MTSRAFAADRFCSSVRYSAPTARPTEPSHKCVVEAAEDDAALREPWITCAHAEARRVLAVGYRTKGWAASGSPRAQKSGRTCQNEGSFRGHQYLSICPSSSRTYLQSRCSAEAQECARAPERGAAGVHATRGVNCMRRHVGRRIARGLAAKVGRPRLRASVGRCVRKAEAEHQLGEPNNQGPIGVRQVCSGKTTLPVLRCGGNRGRLRPCRALQGYPGSPPC